MSSDAHTNTHTRDKKKIGGRESAIIDYRTSIT